MIIRCMPRPNQIMGHANYLRKGTFCLALTETDGPVRTSYMMFIMNVFNGQSIVSLKIPKKGNIKLTDKVYFFEVTHENL
jgi:hypothetical protein